MVNVNKFKAKMVECGLNVDKLSEATGISRATIYRRLNHPEEITIEEADWFAVALEMTGAEAAAIFFNQFVA